MMTKMMTKITYFVKPKTQPHPNNRVAAFPITGGGTAMVYRANSGMLSRKLLRDASTGVTEHHVRDLQQHLNITTGNISADAMVLLIPAGWNKDINDAFTQETLLAESVRMAGEIFGAKTVILSTIMINNNLYKDLKVYDFANYFRNNVNSSSWHGVDQVVLLDLAKVSVELVKANAMALGL